MDDDVEAAVRQLIDKDQIIDLVHRYSYCVDHRLYDEVVELFTEDCVVDYGPGIAMLVRSRSRLRQMFGHPSGGFAATSHHNANVLVTFEDLDHASVRSSVYAWHQWKVGALPTPLGLLPRLGRAPSRGMAYRPATASDAWGRGLEVRDTFGPRW